MPQLGHLLVRPGVLNISSILNYFDIISYEFIDFPISPVKAVKILLKFRMYNLFDTPGAGPDQQMPKLRHANTMPTHANRVEKAKKTQCLVHSTSMCWHSLGMPQLGHLLVRPSVLIILSELF